jgi:uncharacterized protein
MSSEPLKTRIVPCPSCGGDSVYSSANAYRPFCSERCKGIDLGAWASEGFKLAAEPPLDDPLNGGNGSNGNLLQ